ncbi:MAG: tetratricopeptide repeat protein [Pseudomonadota bacterium]
MDDNAILHLLGRIRVAAALAQEAPTFPAEAGPAALAQAAAAAGQGRWEGALQALGGLARLEPALARWAALLQAEALLERGRHEEALAAARSLPGMEDGEARVLEARALFKLRRVAEAEPLLRAVIAREPGRFEAHYGLGLILVATGRLEEALATLRAAQRLNPLDEGPYRAMAHLFRATGQVAQGADLLPTLLRTQLVTSPGLLLDLAELELLAGRPERMGPLLADLEAQAALAPRDMIELGRLYCERQDTAALARLAARAGDTAHPEAAGAALELSALEAELTGDGEVARKLHGQACTALPGHFYPHVRAALLYLYQPTPQAIAAAAAHVREATRLAPQTPDVRLVQALLGVLQGQDQPRRVLEHIAGHAGMRPSVRRLARAGLGV